MAPVLVRGADFRFDPISGKAEAASGPAQFGSTIDDFGHRFITQNTTHIRHVVVPMQYLARAPLLEVAAVAQDISDHGRRSAPMYPLTGPQEWRKQRTADPPAALRRKQAELATSRWRLVHGGYRQHHVQWRRVSERVHRQCLHRRCEREPGASRHHSARRSDLRRHRAKENVEFLASTESGSGPATSPMRRTATSTSPISTGR